MDIVPKIEKSFLEKQLISSLYTMMHRLCTINAFDEKLITRFAKMSKVHANESYIFENACLR